MADFKLAILAAHGGIYHRNGQHLLVSKITCLHVA